MDDYVWDEERDDILFFGRVLDLETLNTVISNCITILDKSQNPREMVLETWITVDFTLRQFLLAGFELSRFCDEDFDLRYSLLPSSFSRLLSLFRETIEYNRKFPLEPDSPQSDKGGGLTASARFWAYVRDNHRPLLENIVKVQKEYDLEMGLESHDSALEVKEVAIFTRNSFDKSKRPVEKMRLEWRKAASKFDESWFKLAQQLNNARNKAAHSFDVGEIGRSFGLPGDNASELIREKCRSILNILLAVKINEKQLP